MKQRVVAQRAISETPTKPRSKYIFRPFIGAFIGFFSFICLVGLFTILTPSLPLGLSFFFVILLIPGMVMKQLLELFIPPLGLHGGETAAMIIVYAVSALPFTVIGSLLCVKKKSARVLGIILLILHLLIIVCGSPFWLGLWDA